MTKHEKFMKFNIQNLPEYHTKAGDEITKDLTKGLWFLKLKIKMENGKMGFYFKNLKLMRDFMIRHELLEENEGFIKGSKLEDNNEKTN